MERREYLWDREASTCGIDFSELVIHRSPSNPQQRALPLGRDRFHARGTLSAVRHVLLQQSVQLWWRLESFQRMSSEEDAGRGNRSF